MIQVFQRRERCPFCLCGAVYVKEEICLCNVCNGAIWITKVRRELEEVRREREAKEKEKNENRH
jgi:hypothetical protein